MKIVNSPFQNGVQSRARLNIPLGVGVGLNILYRYITELSAAGSMYDQFSSAITLDGDFEWEMEFFGNAENYAPLIGSTLDNNQLARVQAGGFLRVRSSGGNATSSTIISTGKSYLLGGRRVGNTLSVLVNSVEESSYTKDSVLGTTTIDAIMAHSGVFTDGGWLNLKIWKGGDRTTGTLVMDATKDGDGSTNVIVNEAATLGPNLWAYGLSGSINAEWNSMLGTTWAGPNVIGDTYLVRYKVTALSDPATFRMSGHDELIDSVGEYEFIATLTKDWGNLNFSARGSIPASIELEYVTVQKIELDTPYLTRVNQTSAEARLYTQVSDGWEGEEEEPQPFNTSTWTSSSGATLVPPNQARLDAIVGGMFKNYGIYGIHRIVVDTPYLTRVNQTSAEARLYTQVSDGWEGEEEEPQPFNTSTWTSSSGATLVPPNQARLDAIVGGMFKNYGIYGIHRIVVDAESDAATLQMKDSPTGMGADPDILVTNPMNQTIDYDFINGGVYFRNIGEVNDVCTVRQVSIKRLIEVT